MKFLFVTASLLSVLAFAAESPKGPRFERILKQNPGGVPKIKVVQDSLVIGSNETAKTFVYPILNDGNLGTRLELPGNIGNAGIAADPASGWVASCYSAGNQILTFNVNAPRDFFEYSIPQPASFGCAGISIESGSSVSIAPAIWIGSPSDRSILRMNPRTGQILQTVSPISGPFHLSKVGPFVFTLNELVLSGRGLPYVFDPRSGEALVGTALGKESPGLTRAYSSEIFDDSATSGNVFYIRAFDLKLVAFSATQPSVTTMTEIPVSVSVPRTINRYKQCLVVLGNTLPDSQDVDWRWAQWSVLKIDRTSGTFKEIMESPLFEGNQEINGSSYQAIDRFGTIYLSHWDGVTRVSGLIDNVDCD